MGSSYLAQLWYGGKEALAGKHSTPLPAAAEGRVSTGLSVCGLGPMAWLAAGLTKLCLFYATTDLTLRTALLAEAPLTQS